MRPTCQGVGDIEGKEDSGQGAGAGVWDPPETVTLLRCGGTSSLRRWGERAKGEVAGLAGGLAVQHLLPKQRAVGSIRMGRSSRYKSWLRSLTLAR